MLKRLTGAGAAAGGGVRSVSTSKPAPAARSLGSLSFADLLGKARAGELQSSRPVTVDDGLGLKLSADQARRLSLAADRAEAEGFAIAAIQLDGRNLLVDVHARRVTGVIHDGNPVAAGIDGVVLAPPPDPSLLEALRPPHKTGLIEPGSAANAAAPAGPSDPLELNPEPARRELLATLSRPVAIKSRPDFPRIASS